MSVSQMAKLIGQTGSIFGSGDMMFKVEIVDVKTAYGKIRYEIKPLAGRGTAWIEASSIVLDRD